ncbi:Phosphatidylinositol 3-/4-kinase, catalytic [Cordyceps fumosorosea ARSEF 2679]|uniref:Phosphatidylinositol 4-kinase n=1 Tax=Cordyceps fumosorosea (strain ARSEF 2679) TaxID=1081104 RepID=A0A167M828_CORFA|nr:Phosphatidylinositol 3-/4-kinase, catalytic [Cordyceps fumosorosea ARSEF 2679]OAA54047.1 Phosphatidylinositol 3-/4-kinase, catalytic [Cordyceps fumosorosea ARSEF 2679]
MPKTRPPTTGYERLAQADRFSDDSDDEFVNAGPSAALNPSAAAPGTPRSTTTRPKFRRRVGSTGGVDIKAINARFERWADEIASKFKRGRGKSFAGEEERLEIQHSVFRAPEGIRPVTAQDLAEAPEGAITKAEFEAIIDSVRRAIRQEIHPSMISQGSSGSYFARDPDGKIVGVFKPKDEEPYAAGNPKWNKWIHRNLFPCCFGRACLIPNLSYVSEAAAYVLDRQLQTNMVPYTDVVWLSSKSFHYPFWDRRNFYRKKKPFPAKPGSFQVFLKGFKDANVFLRENPWPDQYWAGFRTTNGKDSGNRKNKKWSDACRPSTSGQAENADSDDDESESPGSGERSPAPEQPARFAWTEDFKQSFREELEKLVILDYIMRNTDRGLDNWMVKVDRESGAVSIATEPMHLNMDAVESESSDADRPRPVNAADMPSMASTASYPYKRQRPMHASSSRGEKSAQMVLGAIDNSLSWPWKHPDAWRSFPFGWLFLPVDLIGRPFSQKTRDHFLPLLTSTAWWSQTQLALKRVFQVDEDFQERMFAKQIAVMKGQAWNVVEALKTADHGPLELTRRAKVCVWDDLVDVPVAVPMRVTSSEMRRTALASFDQDETDIASSVPASSGGASAAAPPDPAAQNPDLLGFGGDLPNPGRFEIITSPKLEATRTSHDAAPNGALSRQASSDGRSAATITRPSGAPSPSSYHGPSRALNAYDPPRSSINTRSDERAATSARSSHHQRRYSFASTPAGRRSSHSIAQQLYAGDHHHPTGRHSYDYSHQAADDDDMLEGDLGYAAAEGQMGNQRKVIVERLEAVKTSNPVFTWC